MFGNNKQFPSRQVLLLSPGVGKRRNDMRPQTSYIAEISQHSAQNYIAEVPQHSAQNYITEVPQYSAQSVHSGSQTNSAQVKVIQKSLPATITSEEAEVRTAFKDSLFVNLGHNINQPESSFFTIPRQDYPFIILQDNEDVRRQLGFCENQTDRFSEVSILDDGSGSNNRSNVSGSFEELELETDVLKNTSTPSPVGATVSDFSDSGLEETADRSDIVIAAINSASMATSNNQDGHFNKPQASTPYRASNNFEFTIDGSPVQPSAASGAGNSVEESLKSRLAFEEFRRKELEEKLAETAKERQPGKFVSLDLAPFIVPKSIEAQRRLKKSKRKLTDFLQEEDEKTRAKKRFTGIKTSKNTKKIINPELGLDFYKQFSWVDDTVKLCGPQGYISILGELGLEQHKVVSWMSTAFPRDEGDRKNWGIRLDDGRLIVSRSKAFKQTLNVDIKKKNADVDECEICEGLLAMSMSVVMFVYEFVEDDSSASDVLYQNSMLKACYYHFVIDPKAYDTGMNVYSSNVGSHRRKGGPTFTYPYAQ